MLSAIFLVAAIGADRQAEPLFPRLFPNPTGQNALEYYVRAGDIARAERLNLWSEYIAERDNIPNRLEYEEKTAAATTKILDLVRVGNQYPLLSPGGREPREAFPAIKDIAKLASQYARVQFVRGDPDKATDALLLVTEMSDHLYGSGGISQYLTGRAIDSIALAGFHIAYTSISLNGANDILSRFDVRDPSLLADHWSRMGALIDAAVKDGDEQYDADEWNRVRPKFELLTSEVYDIFANEERLWMPMSTALTKGAVQDASTYSPFPDEFLAQNFVRSAVANRTMRRLLRVHAQIAKYRWENAALPLSLGELPEASRTDPGSGQPYVYTKFSEAAYDLYSPGNQYFGDIRLRVSGQDMLRGNPGPP